MRKYKILLFLLLATIFIIMHSSQCLAQDPYGNDLDPGGDLPIPGILYFLAALIGIGVKKLYHGREKN